MTTSGILFVGFLTISFSKKILCNFVELIKNSLFLEKVKNINMLLIFGQETMHYYVIFKVSMVSIGKLISC